MTPKELNYTASLVARGLVMNNPTKRTLEHLAGPHCERIIYLVWKRSRLNARVALAIPDAWKEIGEDYALKRILMGASTHQKIRKARATFVGATRAAYKIT